MHPTTVVIPASTKEITDISGVLVLNPPSPPPPIIWTWQSKNPGNSILPSPSITFIFIIVLY